MALLGLELVLPLLLPGVRSLLLVAAVVVIGVRSCLIGAVSSVPEAEPAGVSLAQKPRPGTKGLTKVLALGGGGIQFHRLGSLLQLGSEARPTEE